MLALSASAQLSTNQKAQVTSMIKTLETKLTAVNVAQDKKIVALLDSIKKINTTNTILKRSIDSLTLSMDPIDFLIENKMVRLKKRI